MEGLEVFGWPEFKAFAERLGVDTSKPIKRIEFALEGGALLRRGQDRAAG